MVSQRNTQSLGLLSSLLYTLRPFEPCGLDCILWFPVRPGAAAGPSAARRLSRRT